VEDHADARLVTAIDQRLEALGVAMTAGGGKVARGLVAPRIVERMLRQRQELDVRETVIAQMRNEALGQLAVGEETAIPGALPRGQVRFVNGHRRMQPRLRASALHPFAVAPLVSRIADDE